MDLFQLALVLIFGMVAVALLAPTVALRLQQGDKVYRVGSGAAHPPQSVEPIRIVPLLPLDHTDDPTVIAHLTVYDEGVPRDIEVRANIIKRED